MSTDLLSFSIVDGDGNTKQFVVHLPTGLTVAQMQTYATALAGHLDAVIDGQITGINVTFGLTIPAGLNGTPANGVEVEKGALLTFSAAGTQYRHSIYVPTFKPGNFSGEDVNQSATGVSTFIGDLVNGASPALPSDKYGNDLTSLLKAKKRFRK